VNLTIEQFRRLANPVCSACDQPLTFDGIAVSHADAAQGLACELFSAGTRRTLRVDDTPEARAVLVELLG
jgi:hypothetical protein